MILVWNWFLFLVFGEPLIDGIPVKFKSGDYWYKDWKFNAGLQNIIGEAKGIKGDRCIFIKSNFGVQ